jgi:hypothetical protein
MCDKCGKHTEDLYVVQAGMLCFHGDNGAGLGASHQTWWTGIIARSLGLFARLQPGDALRISKGDLLAQMTREVAGKAASG